MELSPHFNLNEFTRSEMGDREGVDNEPEGKGLDSLIALCLNVMEPVRALFGRSIFISSGFRCLTLNRMLPGGASNDNSQHIKGEAADFVIAGHTCRDVALAIQASDIPFDQLILEYPSKSQPDGAWLHISFSDRNRGEILTVVKRGKRRHTRVGIRGAFEELAA